MTNTEEKDSGYIKHYPQGNNKYSRDEIMQALLISFGVLAKTMRALSIAHSTLYNYMEEYELYEFRDKCRDNIEDLALDSIVEAMDDPKIAIAMLTHVRHSKQSSERLKIDVDKDGGVNITVSSPETAEELNSFLND